MTQNLFTALDPRFTEKKGMIFCDGGSRGNPGIAGSGAVLYGEDQRELDRVGQFAGSKQTNNYAEYLSLIIGLEMALKNHISHLAVFMDSKLVIEQMKGNWKVKNANIKPLFERAKKLEPKFEKVVFQHIPREKNKVADQIANEVMDRGC